MVTISTPIPTSILTEPVVIVPPRLEVPKAKFHQSALDFSRYLSDDYIHKKFLTLKYTGKGVYFTVNSKATLDFKLNAHNKEVPVTSSEVKFVTHVAGRNIEAKFDNKGMIRFWGNLGVYNLGTPLILTSKLKTNSQFNRWSGNLCFEHIGSWFNILTRFDVKENSALYLNEKLIFNFSPLQMGYILKLNLAEMNLARYNVFLAYNERDYSVYAEHFSKNKKNFELGKLILAGVYRQGFNTFVMKAAYRPYKENRFRVKAAVVSNVDKNSTIRAKIDNSAKLSFNTRYRFSSNLSFIAGTQISLLNPGAYLTNKVIPIPLGLSFEFTYA